MISYIFQAVLAVLGLYLMGDWKIALGVFLFVWGNNIATDRLYGRDS